MTARAFYPGDCRRDLETFTSDYKPPDDLASALAGAVLPHGGWIYSGTVAARTLACLAANSNPETIVIFGGVHVPLMKHALYPSGRWATPLGDIEVDAEMGAALVKNSDGLLQPNSAAHLQEHSIEVLAPMVKYFFPSASLVPILTLPDDSALRLGQLIGEALVNLNVPVVLLASSDLTHYGVEYGMLSAGTGPPGEKWMRSNDQRMIERLCTGNGASILHEAQVRQNACGPGALAALREALSVMGYSRGRLIEYATSHDAGRDPFFRRAVGYVGLVYGPAGKDDPTSI
ncbi:MAG: AmmeMemoRadiSam system protein B [Candidatus Neomarinimicrobiota bacterium]